MKNLTPDIDGEIGVYIIQNEDTLETYFGSGLLDKRFQRHRSQLKNGNHDNHKLQEAYNRNPNFVFIGLPVEAEDVKKKRELAFVIEQLDISENSDNPLVLNISKDVGSPWRKMTHSTETKALVGEKLKGKWEDPQYRDKVVAAQNAGKQSMTEEEKLAHQQSLSEAQKARYERIGVSPTKGQTRTEEFRQRNSANIAQKWQDPEYRERQRLARLGNKNRAKSTHHHQT